MVSLFTWQEDFLTHIPVVDEQHRKLVSLINDLAELVLATRELDVDRVENLIGQLAQYVRVHFVEEEDLSARVGVDPRHRERHRAAHRAFSLELREFVRSPRSVTPDQLRTLAEYLVRWLAFHILDVDQSMARQVHAIEGGASPEYAFEQDEQFTRGRTQPLMTALSGLFHAVSTRNQELRELNHQFESRVAERTVELEEANRRLQILATQDELTGLPNRRFAMLTLERLWEERARYGGELSVLLLDADGFKQVNDRFGHPQGDTMLRVLAKRLRDSVRGSDVVCRLGGDEFVVICPRCDRFATAVVARRILESSKPLLTSEGKECWKGAVSIGLAEADGTMSRVEELLAAADRALYLVKRAGGGSVVDATEAGEHC